MDNRKLVLVLILLGLFVTAYAFRDNTIIQQVTSLDWGAILNIPAGFADNIDNTGSSCDNNASCTITGSINQSSDANNTAWIDFEAFKRCTENQIIQITGGDWTCVAAAAGGGGGTTYTGISPIFVDNDNNIIGLNVQPASDWNGTFDGLQGNDISTRSDADNNYANLYNCDGNSSCTITGTITGASDWNNFSSMDVNALEKCAEGEIWKLSNGG